MCHSVCVTLAAEMATQNAHFKVLSTALVTSSSVLATALPLPARIQAAPDSVIVLLTEPVPEVPHTCAVQHVPDKRIYCQPCV